MVQVMEADHSQALILRPLAVETPETRIGQLRHPILSAENEAHRGRSMSGGLDLPEIEVSP